MNIFYLDKDPELAAQYHCDNHVVKMVLETAQLLCTAHHVCGDGTITDLYKRTHVNHPCSIWLRGSSGNYTWTCNLFTELSREYTKRYGKIHKSYQKFGGSLTKIPRFIRVGDFYDPPMAMPDQYKQKDVVQAYRDYYVGEKSHFATWKFEGEPEWWPG